MPNFNDAGPQDASSGPQTRPGSTHPPSPGSRTRKVRIHDLGAYAAEISRRALGAENREHSTKDELRFGTNGSRKVEITGARAGSYYDFEYKRGGGLLHLLLYELGLDRAAALDWLQRELDLEIESLRKPNLIDRIVCTYDYRDESGTLIYQVVRLRDPKEFRQRRPDNKGGWDWKIKGLRQVPFGLPELLAAPPETLVFIPEGEKDCLNARERGLLATCNAGGAGKWRPEFAPYFAGRDVVVLADNDAAGREHARQVAANLMPVARSARILELPGVPLKGDLSDWFEAGGTAEQLLQLAAAAPEYDPQTAPPRPSAPASAEGTVIALNNPYDNAHKLLKQQFTYGGHRTLYHYRGVSHHWNKGAFAEVSDNGIRSHVYWWLSKCEHLDAKGEIRSVSPDQKIVTKHVNALRAASYLSERPNNPTARAAVPAPPVTTARPRGLVLITEAVFPAAIASAIC